VTIDSIRNFLLSPLPYGVLISILTFILTLAIGAVIFKVIIVPKLKRLKEDNRAKERGIADLEAQEAQFREELDDLRKAEAILIHRNGVLEEQMQKAPN